MRFFLSVIGSILISSSLFAQSFGTVQTVVRVTDSYVNGSGVFINATYTPTTCYAAGTLQLFLQFPASGFNFGNTMRVEISQPGVLVGGVYVYNYPGVISAPISTPAGLVNVDIPTSVKVGEMYVARVRSSNPVGVSGNSNPFSIVDIMPSPLSVIQCPSATSPATLSVTTTAHSPAFTYQWTVANDGSTSGLTPSTGVGATVTAVPTTSTTYKVRASDGGGCILAKNVPVTISSASPNITVAATCSGANTNVLTASGGATYTWSPSTGLNTAIGSTVIATPSVTTTYTVTGNNGCGVTGTTTVTVTPQIIPSSSTFGNNVWNAYCYANDTTANTSVNFYGYYQESNLSFNTANRWAYSGSVGPTATTASGTDVGYTGCSFPIVASSSCPSNTLANSFYSISFKRTGFECGYYQLDLTNVDDKVRFFVDGRNVFNTNSTSANLLNMWSGYLGPNSQVEIRYADICNGGNLAINLAVVTAPTALQLVATTTFPTGTWNVYGFNSQTIGTNYAGYYTENGTGATGYNFNTNTRWSSSSTALAPSTANATNGTAWIGCTMSSSNISLSFKRTGFSCGVYTINVPDHDDTYNLIINGTTVASNASLAYGASALPNGVWRGVLTSTTQVEFQLIQNSGGSGLGVTFTSVYTPSSTTSVWVGGTSTDWATAGNWCNTVPTSIINAIIPAANQPMPLIANGATAQVNSITIEAAVNTFPAASLTNNGTLSVYRNWTNNGNYTDNSNTTFAGSVAQTISGTTNFNNFSINTLPAATPSAVTISSGNIQINGLLNFNRGVINVASAARFNISSTGNTAGANNLSYINGLVTKTGKTAFTFPVGNAGVYQPVSISAPTVVTDAFTARHIHSNPNTSSFTITAQAAPINHVSGIEYWFVNRTTGTSNVTVTLGWTATSGSQVNNLSSLVVAQWNGTQWQSRGGVATGTTTAGTIPTAAAVSTFLTPNSPFTLASTDNANPLPISLTDFHCDSLSGQVKLTWITASELNNSYFTLERSLDGVNFTKIGTVKGWGTTATEHKYSFVDTNPLNGTSYYRLTQTDFDGKQTSFNDNICSTEITVTESPNVLAYPNPVKDRMTIEYKNIGKISGVRLLNSLGVEVPIFYTVSDATVEVNTSYQSSGLYIIELKTDQELVKYKVIIRR